MRLGRPEGAAGSVYVPVVFHNDGPRCELDGHPGMDATGPAGTLSAARNGLSSTGSAIVRRVVLERGGDASALVRASNVPSGSATRCPDPFTCVLVTPPDLRRSTRLAVSLPACPGLTIGPVVPGTTG